MNQPDPYRAARDFHAAVDHKPSWLSIAAGFLAVEIVFMLSGALIVAPVAEVAGSTVTTLVLMASFAFLGATAFWLASRVQRRSPATLFGPPGAALRDGILAAKGPFVLFFTLSVLPPWNYSGFSLNMAPVAWALLLPLSLVVVLIQTGAEEVVYRGWLQQSLARISPSPVIWMVLPSVLFGVAHWSPEMPRDAAAAYVIWAIFFGIACADLTARTGTLGAALGFHFVTNLFSIVITSLEGFGDGLALFTIPEALARSEVNSITLVFDLFYLWMGWMACRIALRR
ncbi:CPBP family intramembrane glutamic endopeptidase [Ovoidimarina sediminis]|uniref:CPBP family intramembrane glutamic endopeptidase n=1 Tax=Ovoidimarina sediminis TaxID=3079856 RepID=UPI00290CDB03|nr:type II CAAX endopeptidase family protein [Rhodophyticola sp. MJ-SS7]MDU8944461.1 type II CAAX endopeptidase family protein [Rhodophyticola sp. MJ-SS7]